MRLTATIGLSVCAALGLGAVVAAEGIKLRPMVPLLVDGAGTAIRQPEGVGCHGRSVVVADTGNGRLLPFTVADDVVSAKAPIVLPQLPRPTRVDLSSKGEMFVVDGKLHKVAQLSSTGEFVRYLDLGTGSSRLGSVPQSVTLDGEDAIWILDSYSARVLVLDAAGSISRQVAFPDEYGFLADIAVDDFGILYAVDSVTKTVFQAKPDEDRLTPLTEDLTEELDFPAGITADPRGRLFLTDRNGGGIVVLDRDGSYRGRQSGLGWKEGFLRYPGALCVDALGDLFVADRGNNRVQVFFIIQ